jgi:hypothetical protein
MGGNKSKRGGQNVQGIFCLDVFRKFVVQQGEPTAHNNETTKLIG